MSAPGYLGRYRLDAVLGTGAFATVHRARDERLGDTVAIKVLADNHSLDPDVRERFLTEGRVLRRIRSAHVVAVHDLAETDRAQPYLVLEHADRGTLADRVASQRAAGWQPTAHDVWSVCAPLVAALRAVHAADVVHRDLSPRNVLIASGAEVAEHGGSGLFHPDERLLVADLGLCKDLALHSGVTVAGGTDGFRPPEQRHGPSAITATADLWSLSALIVWLVTGSPPPSDGPSSRAAVAACGLPDALGEVLDRGLAIDPAARQPDVEVWWTQVRTALAPPATPTASASVGGGNGVPSAGAADAASPTAEPTSSAHAVTAADAPPARPSRGRRLLLWVVALVAAAALGALAVASTGGPTTTEEDGQQRVEAAEGAVSVVIDGPAQLTVGEAGRFVVEGEGITRSWWVDPGGTVHDGAALRITPSSTGTATLRLVAVGEDGDVVVVPFDLRVTDP